MTNLTPEIIETATDEQLKDLVAVHCLGWYVAPIHNLDTGKHEYYWYNKTDIEEVMGKDDWQPHLPTEKGKAQAIDLAEKYDCGVYPAHSATYRPQTTKLLRADSWQIAVLKACLYSEMER